jgi:hypothetical protein
MTAAPGDVESSTTVYDISKRSATRHRQAAVNSRPHSSHRRRHAAESVT